MNLLWAVLSGLGYGLWPLLTKSITGIHWLWLSIGVNLGTLFIIAVATTFVSEKARTVPPSFGLISALSAGIINGLAFLAYIQIASSSGGEASRYLPISAIVVATVPIVGGLWLFQETLTVSKIVGSILGLIAIWLLTR